MTYLQRRPGEDWGETLGAHFKVKELDLSLKFCVLPLCRIIVDKIDTNRDGKLSRDELSAWISKVSKRYVWDDVDRMWDFHDTDHDGFVNLDEHKEVYGLVSGESGGVIYTEYTVFITAPNSYPHSLIFCLICLSFAIMKASVVLSR